VILEYIKKQEQDTPLDQLKPTEYVALMATFNGSSRRGTSAPRIKAAFDRPYSLVGGMLTNSDSILFGSGIIPRCGDRTLESDRTCEDCLSIRVRCI